MPARAVIEMRDVDISRGTEPVLRRLSADIVVGRVAAFVSEDVDAVNVLADVLCGRTNGFRVEGDLVLDGRELVSRSGGQEKTQAEQFVVEVQAVPESRETTGEILRGALRAGRKDDVTDTLHALLTRVGLETTTLDRRMNALSDADRIRLGYAVAIAQRPQVLVVRVNYDAEASTQYLVHSALIHALAQQTPAAWVVATNSIAIAADLADDVHLLLAGRVVEQGSVYDVCLRPTMPYTKDLLLVTPRPHRPLPEYPAFVQLASHAGCPWVLNCREQTIAKCAQETPTLKLVGPGHEAACHLVVQHG